MDAGGNSPGGLNGGNYLGYTDNAVHLIPTLRHKGFTQAEIDLLCIENPAQALTNVKECEFLISFMIRMSGKKLCIIKQQ